MSHGKEGLMKNFLNFLPLLREPNRIWVFLFVFLLVFDCSFWQRRIDRSFTQRDDDVDVLILISFSFDSSHQNDIIIISHTFLSFYLISCFLFCVLSRHTSFHFSFFSFSLYLSQNQTHQNQKKKPFNRCHFIFCRPFPSPPLFLVGQPKCRLHCTHNWPLFGFFKNRYIVSSSKFDNCWLILTLPVDFFIICFFEAESFCVSC